MLFAYDTEVALVECVALVNTLSDDADTLATVADLDVFLARFPTSGARLGTRAELDAVRALRTRLRGFWTAEDASEAAALANALLAEVEARPYLTRHDGIDWHLHVTEPDAPLERRIGGEVAMGVLDLIRTDSLGRLRTCAADDCADVLVDLSRNQSRRYCASGNCGNRANVAAYRARQRGGSDD